MCIFVFMSFKQVKSCHNIFTSLGYCHLSSIANYQVSCCPLSLANKYLIFTFLWVDHKPLSLLLSQVHIVKNGNQCLLSPTHHTCTLTSILSSANIRLKLATYNCFKVIQLFKSTKSCKKVFISIEKIAVKSKYYVCRGGGGGQP